jgi:hypothetical protein
MRPCPIPVVPSASANPRNLPLRCGRGARDHHVRPVDHALRLPTLQHIFACWPGSVVLPA